MPKRKLNFWLKKFHKWAGLTAALWLIVLGATGVFLDHPDWRPLNQITVPESWGSPAMTRFLRTGYMRQILVDPADKSQWLGGSERGLWSSTDGGLRWEPVQFAGLDYSPQLYSIVADPVDGFAGSIVATDDGLWKRSGPNQVERYLLDGLSINSLSTSSQVQQLVGVAERSKVFTLDTSNQQVSWSGMTAIEPVIAKDVKLNRWLLDVHVGHGMAEGIWGILLSDFAGIAMVILGTTGFLYWYTLRSWRTKKSRLSSKQKRTIFAWIFRSHAPIIGVLAVIPIFYLSLTGVFVDHFRAIYSWAEAKTVPAYLVPAGFSMRSLDGDVQDVVTHPSAAGQLAIATRKGLYFSTDDGQNWTPDQRMPIEKEDFGNSLNLVRVHDTLFLGAGLEANFYSTDWGANWDPIVGPFTGVSSASMSESQWFLKNSQGVFSGDLDKEMQKTEVEPPPLAGMTLFLFLADIHTGLIIAPWFPWVNDVFALLALFLVLSGPIIWWKRKWI